MSGGSKKLETLQRIKTYSQSAKKSCRPIWTFSWWGRQHVLLWNKYEYQNSADIFVKSDLSTFGEMLE